MAWFTVFTKCFVPKTLEEIRRRKLNEVAALITVVKVSLCKELDPQFLWWAVQM